MIESVGNHLWQSTLCVAGAAALVRAVGQGRPDVVHRIWLAASIKFLVPFSLIAALGQPLGRWLGPISDAPALVPAGLQAVSQPFSTWAFRMEVVANVDGPRGIPGDVPLALIAMWLIGILMVLGARLSQWTAVVTLTRRSAVLTSGREVDALARVGRFRSGGRPVAIRQSPADLEPSVVGCVRPTLLWPAGLSARLTDEQIEAILTHEMAHVRRRDNLAALVHMIGETLFWFHPLVWWLGAKLIDAREQACDQEVLGQGAHPRTYAESLLDVGRFCLRRPARLAAGVTSSNLSQRVEAIMKYRSRDVLGAGRQVLIGAAAMLLLFGPIAAGTLDARTQATPTPVLPGTAVPVQVPVPAAPVVPVEVAVENPTPVRPAAMPNVMRPLEIPRAVPVLAGPAVPAFTPVTPRIAAPVATVAVNPTTATPVPATPAEVSATPAAVSATPVAVPVTSVALPATPIAVPATASPQTPARDPVPPASPSEAERIAEFRRGAVPVPTPGVTPPLVLREVRPNYTSEAMRQKVQGRVEVEIVVGTDGAVSRARITRSLDSVLGLDQAALEAARQWIFRPARLNGEPVAVWVTLDLDFRLH